MDKKKLFRNLAVVLTAAALAVGTAACKKAEKKSALREASSSDEQSEILEKAKEQSRSGENEEKREEEGDTPSEENAPAEKSTEEAGAAVSDTYAPGINTDSGFESAFIGVRFNTPAGYVLSPQQTIDEQNKVNADSGEENMKYMKYEASVVNDEKTMQVIVASDGNKGDFSEEDYISLVAGSYSQIEGVSVGADIGSRDIAGEQYSSLDITLNNNNKLVYCVRKKGDEMINFMFLYPQDREADMNALAAEFKPY